MTEGLTLIFTPSGSFSPRWPRMTSPMCRWISTLMLSADFTLPRPWQ